MENALYDEILIKRIVLFSIVGILIIITGVVCIFYGFKKMYSEKNEFFMEKSEFFIVTILCAVAVVGSLILTITVVVPSVCDIQNQSYITYNGIFVMDESYERKKNEYSILLLDTQELSVVVTRSIIKSKESNVSAPGNYNGTIVYAEKSKYVVAIQNVTKSE